LIRFLALIVAVCITLIWWPSQSTNADYPMSWLGESAVWWSVLTCQFSIWATCILLVISRPKARPSQIGWVLLALATVELAIPTGRTLSQLGFIPVTVRFLAWIPTLLGAALHGFALVVCGLILANPDSEFPARRVGAVGAVMIVGAYASAQALQLEYPIELGGHWLDRYSPTFVWFREVAKVTLGCMALCLMLDRVIWHRIVLANLWISGWVIGVLIPTAYSLQPHTPYARSAALPLGTLGQQLWWILAWLLFLTNNRTAKKPDNTQPESTSLDR